MTQETGLTVRELSIPATFQDIKGMAEAFAKSGMFQDAKDMYAAVVKIQAGRELGLPPVYSMQNINMIQGRLGTSANTMALLIKASGKYNYRILEHDEQKCTIAFYELEAGKMVEVGKSTFTMKDAERAGLVKPGSGWQKYPRAMLFSRAISQGARLYCPDAIGGVYTTEELQAIPETPERVKPVTEQVEPIPATETPVTVDTIAEDVTDNEQKPPDGETAQSEHYCRIHKTAYFKRGNMKSYGHKIIVDGVETNQWCNESSPEERKKLFAVVNDQGIDHEELKKYLAFHYGVNSTKDLPRQTIDEIIQSIETGQFQYVDHE